MGIIKRALRVALAVSFGQEGGVELEITRAVKVTFQPEEGKSYQVLSSSDAEKIFQSIGEPVAGNGGKISVFYESEENQKVFFKVEETKADFAINDRDLFKKVEFASLYGIGNLLHELRRVL
ncbi:MAG TPA: hypothetical protein EYQ50_26285 [Verrucomicrobiales bacterium]|nr:hypothetical protein [Verrucomicrobiales bacterium]